MPTDAATLRDFAARYTAAWCSHDPGRVASFFSPGASLAVNNGSPAVGREAIAEFAQSFMTTFPDLKVAMDDLRVQVDCAEYDWTLTGTNHVSGGKSHKVRIRGLERWRIGADDLIASSQGHFDADDYQRQLEQGI